MRGKLLFVAGATVGYVFGTRAGRQRYEQLKAGASKVWESPGVQKQVHALEDFVAEKIGEIPEATFNTVKKVVGRRNERRRGSRAPSSSAAARTAARPDDDIVASPS